VANKSYQKGYRFEKKVQAWLAHLGTCTRAFMSRGADLMLDRRLRRWTFSCKCREESICKLIDKELESADFFVWGYDRGVPIVAGPLPKLVELCVEIAEPIE
jgi:hypothetical protein